MFEAELLVTALTTEPHMICGVFATPLSFPIGAPVHRCTLRSDFVRETTLAARLDVPIHGPVDALAFVGSDVDGAAAEHAGWGASILHGSFSVTTVMVRLCGVLVAVKLAAAVAFRWEIV